MSKFPVYLNFNEIKKHLKSLKTTDAKINYYEYILGIYNEMFSHKSLKDINSYINKYKFRKQLKSITEEKPIDPSDIKFVSENVNGYYSGTGYEKLHDKISLLYTSIEYDLTNLKFYNFIVASDFKLVFTEADVINELNTFTDDSSKLNWLKELNKRTYTIAKNFTDRYIDLLYIKYNLKDIYTLSLPPKDKIALTKYKGKYDLFRRFITISFGHILKSLVYDLEFEISVKTVKSLGPLAAIPEEDKYLLPDYKFDTLNRFAEKAFSYLEEKIEYFSYALSVFYTKYPGWANEKPMQDEIRKIEYRLNYLKTKYEMRKNGISVLDPHNSELKKDISKNSNVVSKSNINFPVIRDKQKPKWLKGEQKLIFLLEQLQLKGFIEDKLENPEWKEQYLALFINQETKKPFSNFEITPILWNEKVIDLACLIHELNLDGFKPCIDNYHRSKKISNVFLCKSNDDIKIDYINSDTLNSEISKVKNNKISKWEIAEIALSVRQYRG